jgi:hypothetical protein
MRFTMISKAVLILAVTASLVGGAIEIRINNAMT